MIKRKMLDSFSILLCLIFCLTSCYYGKEKYITVVVREPGSGTREAFDRIVTDGEHYLEEEDENGKKKDHTAISAVVQTKNGTLLSSVATDRYAIGYVSLGSVNDRVKVLSINGVFPTEESVLNGSYRIRRPFVIMTRASGDLQVRTADFLSYLQSNLAKQHVQSADCIYLSDPLLRGGEGGDPIPESIYHQKNTLPGEGKIVIRGSTSVERLINSAAAAYAAMYGVPAQDVFDIRLEGTSVGRRAVEDDQEGNVIGLSSASVSSAQIKCFYICYDAVAVIVNVDSLAPPNLTLSQVYDIFSGRTVKFSEIG